MGWRRIVVDGLLYRWHWGSTHIVIQNWDGKRVGAPHPWTLKGMTPDAWERALWKGSNGIGVWPSDVARYIGDLASHMEATAERALDRLTD